MCVFSFKAACLDECTVYYLGRCFPFSTRHVSLESFQVMCVECTSSFIWIVLLSTLCSISVCAGRVQHGRTVCGSGHPRWVKCLVCGGSPWTSTLTWETEEQRNCLRPSEMMCALRVSEWCHWTDVLNVGSTVAFYYRCYHIAGNFHELVKNTIGLLAFAVPKDATPPNFTEKTFANSHKPAKFTKVLSWKFPAIRYSLQHCVT